MSVEKVEKILKESESRKILIRVDEVYLHTHISQKKYIRGCIFITEYFSEIYFIWIPYSLLVNLDINLCTYMTQNGKLVTETDFVKFKQGRKKGKETKFEDKYVSAKLTSSTLDFQKKEEDIRLLDFSKFKEIKEEEPEKKPEKPQVERHYSEDQLYTMCFNMKKVFTLKRNIPTIGWSYLIINLANGVSQLPLFFHDGGMNYFFQELKKHVSLGKNKMDSNVFTVSDVTSPFKKSLNKMGFNSYYEEVSEDKWYSQIKKTAKKVKNKILSSSKKKREEFDRKPVKPIVKKMAEANVDYNYFDKKEEGEGEKKNRLEDSIKESEFQDFVVIENSYTNLFKTVDSRWKKNREKIVTKERWENLYCDEKTGKIQKVEQLLDDVFYGGIDPEIRGKIWPFLIGYYPWKSTGEEREKKMMEKKKGYLVLKTQWTSISDEQKKNFRMFTRRVNKIQKDVIRTDRTYKDYQDETGECMVMLRDILTTYTFYNFDLGYCQGMNDLLSPILSIIRNESESFWIFVELMKKYSCNFSKTTNSIDEQLTNLLHVIRTLDYEFYCYLEDVDANNLFFCFRWILVLFKREYTFEDTMRLWDAIFSGKLNLETMNFSASCLISYGMLSLMKDEIMEKKFNNDEIFKFCIEKANKFDMEKVLKEAELAYYKYSRIEKKKENQ